MTPEQQLPDITNLVAKGISQGVSCAIIRFCEVHRVNGKPSEASKAPLLEFSDLFMSEFKQTKEEADKYPFTDSFKAQLWAKIEECHAAVLQLVVLKDEAMAEKVVRTISYLEALLFLDNNRLAVIGLINKIRGDL